MGRDISSIILPRSGLVKRETPGMLRTLRSVMRFGPLKLRTVDRRLAKAASIEDLRIVASRRLPRGVFDYIDGAAEDEVTLAANAAA